MELSFDSSLASLHELREFAGVQLLERFTGLSRLLPFTVANLPWRVSMPGLQVSRIVSQMMRLAQGPSTAVLQNLAHLEFNWADAA